VYSFYLVIEDIDINIHFVLVEVDFADLSLILAILLCIPNAEKRRYSLKLKLKQTFLYL